MEVLRYFPNASILSCRYQHHQQYLKEHKGKVLYLNEKGSFISGNNIIVGHESQHELMAIILLFALFSSQFLILYWKKKHYSSYQVISLTGLYLFPALFALYDGWPRFLTIWTLFSLVNGFGKGRRLLLDGDGKINFIASLPF